MLHNKEGQLWNWLAMAIVALLLGLVIYLLTIIPVADSLTRPGGMIPDAKAANAKPIPSKKLKKNTYEYISRKCKRQTKTIEVGVPYIECFNWGVSGCHADPFFYATLGSCEAWFTLVLHGGHRDHFQQWDATVFFRKTDGRLERIEPTTWNRSDWKKLKA